MIRRQIHIRRNFAVGSILDIWIASVYFIITFSRQYHLPPLLSAACLQYSTPCLVFHVGYMHTSPFELVKNAEKDIEPAASCHVSAAVPVVSMKNGSAVGLVDRTDFFG